MKLANSIICSYRYRSMKLESFLLYNIIVLTDKSSLVRDHILVVIDSCEWNVFVLNRRDTEQFLEEKK